VTKKIQTLSEQMTKTTQVVTKPTVQNEKKKRKRKGKKERKQATAYYQCKPAQNGKG